MKPIDLGRKYDDHGSDIVAGPPPEPNDIHYPSLWIEGKGKAPNIPMSGKAIIEYKVNRKSDVIQETNDDKKKEFEISLDVHSFCPCDDDEKSDDNDDSDEDEIDREMRESEKKFKK